MKLIFSHIPKTAGTSLRSFIHLNYPKSRRYACYPLPKEKDFEYVKNNKAIEIVSSHMEYGYHTKFGFPSNYLSFIREPVEQVLSNYAHLKRLGFDKDVAREMTLDEFLNTEDGCNLQTQYFSGILWGSEKYNNSPDEVLALAKHNMDKHYALVGLTERYEESIFLMQKKLGFQYYQNLTLNKNTEYKKEISKEIRSKISDANQLDIELYEYGKELFDKTFKPYEIEYASLENGERSQHNELVRSTKYFFIGLADLVRNKI